MGRSRNHYYDIRYDEAVVISANDGDLTLDNRYKNDIGELTANQIRGKLLSHKFTQKELEYLVDLLLTRLLVFLNNKAYMY